MKEQQILQPVMQLTSKSSQFAQSARANRLAMAVFLWLNAIPKLALWLVVTADGYPRLATGESKVAALVAVDGKLTQLIGRVSMDMLFVDLTDLPTAAIGSQVELWGDQISANTVAKAAGTMRTNCSAMLSGYNFVIQMVD